MSEGIVLITGGSRGIGLRIVEALIQDGFRVAFTFCEGESAARSLEEELAGRAKAFQLDLRDRRRPKHLVDEVQEALGPIFGLVNNAGVRRDGLLAMTSDDDWEEVMNVDLGGVFRMCRAVLPSMVHQRRGSIVNVSSLSALHGVAGQTAYSAAKAGALGLTRSLAREMGKRGIRVNAVVPGFVETDFTRDIPAERIKGLRANECLPSGTSADGVASAVCFLLQNASSTMTGQSLVVDAGASA